MEKIMNKLYQITLSYVCAGIICKDKKIIKTAPIFNWMVGKSISEIRTWVKKKSGKIKLISG